MRYAIYWRSNSKRYIVVSLEEAQLYRSRGTLWANRSIDGGKLQPLKLATTEHYPSAEEAHEALIDLERALLAKSEELVAKKRRVIEELEDVDNVVVHDYRWGHR